MTLGKLPRRSRRSAAAPIMYEAGFLYFCIEPWSQAEPVYLKIPGRSVRYWLNRLADWHDVGLVTHLQGGTQS